MSPSTTIRCAPAPRPRLIIWRCSNTSPSTLSDSTRSNVKAASKPADSSPLPQTYTALNCSDSYDVHATALAEASIGLLARHGDGIGIADQADVREVVGLCQRKSAFGVVWRDRG